MNTTLFRNALPSLDRPAVGHMMSALEVKSYLTSALATAPHTVVLFLQDKVSISKTSIVNSCLFNEISQQGFKGEESVSVKYKGTIIRVQGKRCEVKKSIKIKILTEGLCLSLWVIK